MLCGMTPNTNFVRVIESEYRLSTYSSIARCRRCIYQWQLFSASLHQSHAPLLGRECTALVAAILGGGGARHKRLAAYQAILCFNRPLLFLAQIYAAAFAFSAAIFLCLRGLCKLISAYWAFDYAANMDSIRISAPGPCCVAAFAAAIVALVPDKLLAADHTTLFSHRFPSFPLCTARSSYLPLLPLPSPR